MTIIILRSRFTQTKPLIYCIFSATKAEPTDRWRKIALLKFERAYASSVVLPDGSIWILGGLGTDSILKSTEIIKPTAKGNWRVYKGPDLPKPLFGHCVEKLPCRKCGNAKWKILLSGGFDGNDQTDTSKEFEWYGSFEAGKWTAKPWSAMKTQRYDHVCFSSRNVVYTASGWKSNYEGKLKTERFNATSRRWTEVDSDVLSGDVDEELPDILRSASVGVSKSNVALIGGVRCTVNDTTSGMKTCYKHKDVFELGYRTAMNVTKWKQADHQIGLPRSSHSIIVVPQSIDYSCQADD